MNDHQNKNATWAQQNGYEFHAETQGAFSDGARSLDIFRKADRSLHRQQADPVQMIRRPPPSPRNTSKPNRTHSFEKVYQKKRAVPKEQCHSSRGKGTLLTRTTVAVMRSEGRQMVTPSLGFQFCGSVLIRKKDCGNRIKLHPSAASNRR